LLLPKENDAVVSKVRLILRFPFRQAGQAEWKSLPTFYNAILPQPDLKKSLMFLVSSFLKY
jgi:hypothetical protein